MRRIQVQTLVGKLRFYELCGVVKKTKQANKTQKGEYTGHINKSRATLPEKMQIP